MRRIRRKQRFTWMPTLGGPHQSGDDSYVTSYFGGAIGANSAEQGAQDIYVTPIVPDFTEFPSPAEPPDEVDHSTLRDFTEGQDWLLKRLVGRISVFAQQIADDFTLTPPFVTVGAAFFVARADDANQNIPDLNSDEIDPLAQRNIRNPWLWRRTWLLRNQIATGAIPLYTGSADNTFRASAIEGNVLDTKIARRIRREQRLFFVINAYGHLDPSGVDAENSYETFNIVKFHVDYRVLGAMRRSTNKSAF